MGFDKKITLTTELFNFDFSALLASGETINSAPVTATVVAGSGQPGTPLTTSGQPSINNGVVSQLIAGGQPGTVYLLTCLATTNLGQTLVLYSELQVVAPI